ncbi:polysaccharide deacetylase family protein [Seonamhaeicola sp.]|uniref:polysaccharide deacetylase family protein n=1 Tax=Seonamhaeicola sp. TaxID=1912245 RepID=UPI003564E5A5
MSLTPIKTPVIAKRMFPNYIWDIPSSNKTIYLTFDDGPTPEITNWVLKTLNEYNAKATFFCIGKNIENHPSIFKNIINQGHSVGNHTQNHIKGWNTKTEAYIKNIEDCKKQLSKFQAKNTKPTAIQLFRPPYGKIKLKQGKQLTTLGYKVVMWDVLSFDWDKNVSEEICFNNVISKAKSGSIVVFHDSVKASKNMMYALPKVLDYFSKLDYTFKAIS